MFGKTLEYIELLLGESDLPSPPDNPPVNEIYAEVADSDYGSYPDALLMRRITALGFLYAGLGSADESSTLKTGSMERQVDDRSQVLFVKGLDNVA